MMQYDELIAAPRPRANRRVQYGTGPLHFGDLWLPTVANAESAKVATIVLIHGGCWQAAYSLDHAGYAASALAAAGYVVWLPEYRRLGDAGGGWPGRFDDVANAVDFVRVLAETEPMIDTARVIAGGHSAGGQLALWAATRRHESPNTSVRASESPLALVGVVSLAGITDLERYADMVGSCNASVTPLLGGRASEVPERYRGVSPIERLPIGVRIHLVHGARDPIVPLAMSNDFATRAKAA